MTSLSLSLLAAVTITACVPVGQKTTELKFEVPKEIPKEIPTEVPFTSPTPPPVVNPLQVNLIQNAGFENGMSNWVNWGNALINSQASEGNSAMRVGTAAGGFGQRITTIMPEGKVYRLSGKLKLDNVNEGAWFGIKFQNALTQAVVLEMGIKVTSANYATHTRDFTAPAGNNEVYVYLWKDDGTGYVYADGLSLLDISGASVPTPTPTPKIGTFNEVNNIIKARCLSCHSTTFASGGVRLAFANETEFLNTNLVKKGSPVDSLIYQSVMGLNGKLRMPTSAPLPAPDLSIIESYIRSLDTTMPVTYTLAQIDPSTSSYDANELRVGFNCLANGVLTYRISQSLSTTSGFQPVTAYTVNCLTGQSLNFTHVTSSISGLVQNHVRLEIFQGDVSEGQVVLSRMPSVSDMPMVQNVCATPSAIVPTFAYVKLSATQIKNIILDLFSNEFSIDATAAVQIHGSNLIEDAVEQSLTNTNFFGKQDRSYSKQNAQGIFGFYEMVVAELAKTSGFATKIEARCGNLTNQSCYETILQQITNRLMKGQMPAQLRINLLAAALEFPSRADAILALVEAAILHPAFGFEVYLKNETPGVVDLSTEELFYKSYLAIFNTLPSWQQVSDFYLSGVTYDVYLTRLITTNMFMRQKFQKTMEDFYGSWLNLKGGSNFTSNNFLYLLSVSIPSALQANFVPNSQSSFARRMAELTAINNLDIRSLHFPGASDLTGLPFESIVDYSNGTEAALGSIPALIFNGSEKTNPFVRGGRVYKRLLCGDFGSTTADNVVPPAFDHTISTREAYEKMTPQGSSCFGCHQNFNAIGFNLEGYDVLGKKRTRELTYDRNGSVLSSHPLRLEGTIRYMGSFYHSPNFETLYQQMYNKGVLKKCTTKQLGHYFLRLKNTPANVCALESVNTNDSDNIQDIIFKILTSDAFVRVRIP